MPETDISLFVGAQQAALLVVQLNIINAIQRVRDIHVAHKAAGRLIVTVGFLYHGLQDIKGQVLH